MTRISLNTLFYQSSLRSFCLLIVILLALDSRALRTLIFLCASTFSIFFFLEDWRPQDRTCVQTREHAHSAHRCNEISGGSFLEYDGNLTFYESRAFPNQRLVEYLDVCNAFTSSDEAYCKPFRTSTVKLLDIEEHKWESPMIMASGLPIGAIDHREKATIPKNLLLVPFIQLIVFQFMLSLMFSNQKIWSNLEAASVVTKKINALWMASKTGSRDGLARDKAVLKEELQKILPNANWTPENNPLNLILPSYETAWCEVLSCFFSVRRENLTKRPICNNLSFILRRSQPRLVSRDTRRLGPLLWGT